MINTILYIFIFLMGITFGSFFTLAVYRIPLGQDITHTRSYCPNCNHKLSFFDMIPILSYLFLGGKCRYCHKKIRIRYLLLEVFSGLVFVLFSFSIKLNLEQFNLSAIAYLVAGLLYIAGLFIIAGIDKEKVEINNGVLLYTIVVEVLYIIYLYIVEKANIYRYVIYLFLIIVFMVINNFYFRKNTKNSYIIECLILIITMLTFTYEMCTILTIDCCLLAVAIYEITNKIRNRKLNVKKDKQQKENNIPIGFYLCVSNIVMLIATNIIIFYGGIF